MTHYSPLRYPGGKNKLAKFIALMCEINDIFGHYVEPYAGGASVALHLLINGYVKEVTINDIDRSIYAFWYSCLNKTDKLCELIDDTEITIENWKKQKEIQQNREDASLFELGFSTLFLNRTNTSGIMNGGVIGGVGQKGKYKIDCRFNKSEIIKRIKLIAKYKKNIHLYQLDALELIKKIQKESKNKQTIFYFDPPYYLKGRSLYTNYYKHEDHLEIYNAITNIKNSQWIVSYDNTPEIKKIYKNFKPLEYSFLHTAYRSKEGREVLFFNKNLIVPEIQDPIKLN